MDDPVIVVLITEPACVDTVISQIVESHTEAESCRKCENSRKIRETDDSGNEREETKDIPGVRSYVAIDGGMFENVRPALYGAKYSAFVVGSAAARPGSQEPHLSQAHKTVTICGKCCESGDNIIRDIELPELSAGDILATPSTGAYGYSMASNYNRNRVPGVVFVKDGKAEWAVKPQTYEDITANDVIPESLR